MDVLVINAGSSSLKFQLINPETEKIIIKGHYDRIGGNCFRKITFNNKKIKEDVFLITDYNKAIEDMLDYLVNNNVVNSLEEIKFVGHRVVHGGEKYAHTLEINDDVLKTLDEMSFLAPLHNPINLKCIKTILYKLPNSRNFAIFDTAFHQTMPKEVYLYALPKEIYEKYKIRKYGFHGTSHKFVGNQVAKILNKPLDQLKIITCHLGNGQSICAIKNGKSLDTSMGFTPLSGLPMGTRSGDFDPEIILFLLEHGYSKEDIKQMINKKSGLLGISNISNDHREIEDLSKDGNQIALLTNNILVNRIVKTIGSYISEMNGCDVIVFTGGIGENSPYLRNLVISHFSYVNTFIDANKNDSNNTIISKDDSQIKVMVIPTNEELQIAREVKELL